jgi:hexosaminidase
MPRLAAALALALATLAGTAFAARVDVIPEPASVEAGSGAPVTIGAGAAVLSPPGDAGAARTARYLANLVSRTRGLTLRPMSSGAGVIVLKRSTTDLGAEGYRLDVGDGRVTIAASTDAGLFYGAVTLWQLITADEGRGPVRLDPVAVADQPRFAWRGLLLDSARHFQSPAFVERTIDWMALHKLNTLQWHLTDDQGWRIEIKKYPRLTSVGAWRLQPDRKTGKPVEYGGFYTQAQIRRIVAYAATRHVTIVPEIDMPGHSLSAITAYPFLGSAPPAKGIRGDWGIFPFLLNPNDRTYAVMTDVLAEVMALFPSHWINVGGDEAVKDEWRASPQIQAQIKALGLPNEDALQGWFTTRIAGFLAKHGRRTIGWDDILTGGDSLPTDAAVVSWHLDGAVKAANAGHDAVIATDPTLYFDHRQADGVSEPPGRGAVVSIADVYSFEPAPATLPAAQAAHIFGVQANLWTEHMRTEDDVERMALPRAAALAELGWTAPDRKDWADFQRRMPGQLARYRALGLDADAAESAAAPSAGQTRLRSQELGLCTNKLVLNLDAPRDAQQARPYLVDIMNPCWIYPRADLARGGRLSVSVTRLPFNFQIGADAAKIALAPPSTPDGELEVRDGCDGPLLQRLPLAPATHSAGDVVLSTSVRLAAGRHDLCLTFTRRELDPMWVVGWAEYRPEAAR